MIVGIIVGIVAVAVIVGFVFVNQPSFGRAPQGERLERIRSRLITKTENSGICTVR